MAEKRRQRQHAQLLHRTLILARTKNCDLPKRLPKKTLPNKPGRWFWKTWLWLKNNKATETEIILRTQLTRNFANRKRANFKNLQSQPWTLPKETDFANQNQSWAKMLAKKRQADFRNLRKWTRTFANAENKAKRKAMTWKLVCWNQTQILTWKNTTTKKWFWISELNPKLVLQRRFCICSWLPNGLR